MPNFTWQDGVGTSPREDAILEEVYCDLDFGPLTEEASPAAGDFLCLYDGVDHKKVDVNKFGVLGLAGTWSAVQMFSAGIIATESAAPTLAANQAGAYAENVVTADNVGWTLQGEQTTSLFRFCGIVSAITFPAIYIGNITPSVSNYAIAYDASGTATYINGVSNVFIKRSNATKMAISNNGAGLNAGPATGTNVFMLSAGAAWTPVADASAMWTANVAEGDNRFFFRSEIMTISGGYNAGQFGNGIFFTGDGTGTYNVSSGSGNGAAIGFSKTGAYAFIQSANHGVGWNPIYIQCGDSLASGDAFRIYISNDLKVRISQNQNVIVHATGAALATTATNGFFYLPSCAGTPTGVPALLPTGAIPCIIDSTNHKLYFYSGGAWRDAGP